MDETQYFHLNSLCWYSFLRAKYFYELWNGGVLLDELFNPLMDEFESSSNFCK
jgi:hypothetical protein